MPSTDKQELREQQLNMTIGGMFWQRATMTTADQPDGGDTWHISKREFNAYMKDMVTLITQRQLDVLEQVQEVIEAEKRMNLRYHGRSDCKSCSLAENIESMFDAIKVEQHLTEDTAGGKE